MEVRMLKRISGLAIAVAMGCALTAPVAGQIARTRVPTAPEQFSANANVTQGAGASAATLVIVVDRYNTSKERDALADVLRRGGSSAFLPALRQSSPVGHIDAGPQRWTVRYAHQRTTGKGRTIVVITDEPMYFVGGGRPEAKPREGYDVAVAQFDVDDVGLGTGTMAAAARVKIGGPAGVQIDDYAEKPIQFVTIRRLPS
jgi:hypothetical protein